MTRLTNLALVLGLTLLAGCVESTSPAGAQQKKPAAENRPADDGKGIFGKKTQDIGKFDPNLADQVVSNQKINATDPITAPFSAYGPILESAAMLTIKHDIDIFEATELHYPTYEEFMEKIIKANNIQLPVLPFKGRYMYDESKHELVIVRDRENAEKAK
jgi:hypothetical protein